MMFDNNNVHKIVKKAIKDSKLKGSVNKSNGGKVTTYTKNNSMFTIKVESFRSFFAGETISFLGEYRTGLSTVRCYHINRKSYITERTII